MHKFDAVIFGGGIAGLWTLARLSGEGYRVLLLERSELGSGQTIASQGIIHGGIKYTLGLAEPGEASRAIAEMPEIWRACLEGRGEVDLRAASVLSPHQSLWTTPGLLSRIAGLGASKVIRTEVKRLGRDERPPIFNDAPRGIDVYQVDEPVLSIPSVVRALAGPQIAAGRIARIDFPGRVRFERRPDEHGGAEKMIRCVLVGAGRAGEDVAIEARRWIFAAGEGNGALLDAAWADASMRAEGPLMQTRPLHMVMVRNPRLMGGEEPVIFGHCLGASNVPRLTINTDRLALSGEWVWYVGGQIAETGVGRSAGEQIEEARRELSVCLPWVDLSGASFATFRVNRAEGVSEGQAGGKVVRPDGPMVMEKNGVIVGWPTKLAFAPLFASRVLELMRRAEERPTGDGGTKIGERLVVPRYAVYPWEEPGQPGCVREGVWS